MRSFINTVFLLLVFFNSVSFAAMPELEMHGKLETVSDMSISPNGEFTHYGHLGGFYFDLNGGLFLYSINAGRIDFET